MQPSTSTRTRRVVLGFAACALMAALGCGSGRAMADELDTGCGGIAGEQVGLSLHEMHEGRTTSAKSYASKALALYPNCTRAFFARGHAEMEAADDDAAIADFTHVVNAHPEYPIPYFARGIAYLHGRHPADALADFDRAIKADVSMSRFNGASLLARRSIALEMLGNKDLALADFKAALATTVNSTQHDYDVLDEHCFSATVVGLLDMAQLTCDESVARHSRNIRIYNARGFLEVKRGLWEQAIADYTQSLYYRPHFPQSLYGRGVAKLAKGDTAGAAADMQAAAKEEPDIAATMARYGVQPKA